MTMTRRRPSHGVGRIPEPPAPSLAAATPPPSFTPGQFSPPETERPRRAPAPGAAPTNGKRAAKKHTKVVKAAKARTAAAATSHSKKNDSGMSAALEDSNTRPSRKSTRGSSNRLKVSTGKERTAVANTVRPSARAARAKVARGRR